MALNDASTNIGIYAFWSSISIGMVHYQYWHLMVPVPVMAFMHFGPLGIGIFALLSNTSMGTVNYRYWH
jgi:hypothetical protein